MNILRYGLKTGLDYRLYEKRFIYRQLLAIYDSKLSDHEMKLDILELIKSTCQLKPALIDLIKKHYLIIWLTNTIIKLQQDQGDKLLQNNNKNLDLFNKLSEIYLIIWSKITESSFETKTNPPALFLTQMFGLLKIILEFFSKISLDGPILDDAENGCLLYKSFFKVVNEILSQTRQINENQNEILNTYCLTEVDLKRLFRLRMKKCFENINEIHTNYFHAIVGLFQNKGLIKALSLETLFENTKFILDFISNKNEIEKLNAREEKFQYLFSSIQNLLSYFNSIEIFDNNYDVYYEISINIIEFLANLNQFKDFDFNSCQEFCETFKEFLVKIKKFNNSEEVDIDAFGSLYDNDEKRFFNENCYSFIIG
jgi:hypothetical protein